MFFVIKMTGNAKNKHRNRLFNELLSLHNILFLSFEET